MTRPAKKIFQPFKDLRHRERKGWPAYRCQFKHPELYSPELRKEVLKRFKIATEYLAGKPIEKVCKTNNIPEMLIRRFANDILQLYSIELIAKRQFRYKGKYGVFLAQTELKEWELTHNRLPKISDKGMGGIVTAIINGLMQDQGIDSWNTLLFKTFGDTNTHRYKGKRGLKKAIAELKTFYQINNRLPTTNDKEFRAIRTAIYRETWIQQGITSWNTLLQQVFGKINVEMGKYTGKDGFNRAIREMRHVQEIHNRLPVKEDKEIGGIVGALKRGEWIEQGITNWNEFLLHIFGEINVERKIYYGKEGLETAIVELREFHKGYERLPLSTDCEFETMRKTAERGIWDEFGITSWNELLWHTFEQVNLKMNVYVGEKGLDQATKELREFQQQYQRLPKSADFRSIVAAIGRGAWTEYQINSWNELLMRVFGKINARFGVYTEEKGLQLATDELRQFERANNRLPTTRDVEMGGIKRAISRKEWSDLGVNTWNDLLKKTFGTVNTKTNIYTGAQGLNHAINQLKGFYTKHHRLPTTRDEGFGGVVAAIMRGEWEELGIASWNNLLKRVFGEVNTKQYSGEDGLSVAMEKLCAFKRKHKRLPTNTNAGMTGITHVIYQGTWRNEGVKTWNDLVRKTFGTVNRQPGKYSGETGLHYAMTVLKEFKETHQRLPTTKDRGSSGIKQAIYAGKWTQFGITSWNDFLQRTFGMINKKYTKE